MKLDSHKVSLFNGLWINDWNYNLQVVFVLMALEVLLAYSPFGFIVLSTISMTTLFVGVLIAALWGGPIAGGMVGLVFGLTSMWKASVTAVNPNDLIFSPVRSGNPAGSILLALGPRVLFGVIAGLVYYLIMRLLPRKSVAGVVVLLVASALLERVHSSLTYLFMDKVFRVEGASWSRSWQGLLSVNRLHNFELTILIVGCAYLLFDRFLSGNYYEQYTKIQKMKSTGSRKKYFLLILVTSLVIAITAAHLWERIEIVLFDINHLDPGKTNSGLIAQVIYQFIAAMLAAMYIFIVLYRHARSVEEMERTQAILQLREEKEKVAKMERSALTDPLTGVFNRKGLERAVAEEPLASAPIAYLLLDVDRFKEINDNFGHEAGDLILKEMTGDLVETFGEGSVFRIGGDEFAVVTAEAPWATREALEENWASFNGNFAQIHRHLTEVLGKGVDVTLSVGVCCAENGYGEHLYSTADRALYRTKKAGRAGCTLVDADGTVVKTWKEADSLEC